MKIIEVDNWMDIPKHFVGIAQLPKGIKFLCRFGEFHRMDTDQIEFFSGTKAWSQNNELHRLDGPAIEHISGKMEFWVLGEELTKKQFDIFRYLWDNTTYEKTNDLMKTFVNLAKRDSI